VHVHVMRPRSSSIGTKTTSPNSVISVSSILRIEHQLAAVGQHGLDIEVVRRIRNLRSCG
jgi:hypothetical protein